MKKIAMIFGVLMMIFSLNSCIVANAPGTKEVIKVPVGDKVQFKVSTIGGLTVWKLNDKKVALGNTYIFNAKEPGSYSLRAVNKVRITWKIEVYEDQTEPDPEICDGKDNDADGKVDEDIAAINTTCGVGACSSTGKKTCVNGQWVDSCVAGASAVEVCDGADNDCDGKTDEDLETTPTTCGAGACASTGENACVNGKMVDTCKAGTPGTEICDNLDNDCDGSIDEDIDPAASTCGVGACASTGQKTCVNGKLEDTCKAGTPSAEICDNIDNDCDGTTDEDIPTTPTVCGTVGACAATGKIECVGGVMKNTCVAGTPGTEVCNNIDDDCDGTEDEGIAAIPTTCGPAGTPCAATGSKTCVNGAMVDSCVPGTPGQLVCEGVVPGDVNCNSINDPDECDPTTCPTVSNVQASDASSGLPYVQISWDPCPTATKYKVYRAIYEDNSAYELIGEPTAPSFKVEYNWKTDVDDKIGLVPRMAPDATMAEKTAFGIELSDFREKALPYYMKFKAPSFFKVEACVGDVCSPASAPEPGQAKLIHVAATGTELDGTYQHNSEVAELVIPSWGYPGLYTLSTVEPEVLALNWCGLDICAPSGGGYVLGRLRSDPVPIQVDVWYDTWKEVWAAHPNAYFIAEGYMGGEQQAASGAKGIVLLQGAFTMDIPGTHVDAYIWFYTGGASGHPNDGQMDITVDGVTYTYELPVQPADWINTHGTPSIKLTKPVRPALTQIGTPVDEWHMPFSEFDTNGVDDDWDGVIDNDGESMLCPDGENFANQTCFSPEIP